MTAGTPEADADVIVVGAGPGGSSAAYHLASHGLRVLLLERSTFPRDKVCGDGLTPRGVQQIQAMGVGVSAEVGRPGIARTFPARSSSRRRGVSARLPVSLGFHRQPSAPVGVAVRRYYRSVERQGDPYLEVVLDVPTSAASREIAPGYGWIFGVGDGRVNVGLAIFDSAGRYSKTDHRQVFTEWLRTTPPEWGLADDANADGPVRGAAIPMGFSRSPPYQRGLLLVGDCAGMANPFTGEGIAYVMESGALAAEVALGALAVGPGPRREAALDRYGAQLSARYASYYRLGRHFVKIIDNGAALKFGIKHVLPRPVMMRVLLKLMCHLADPDSPEAPDRVISALLNLRSAA